MNDLQILSFSNKTPDDLKLLKRFVDFHWELYRDEPNYVPLLDFEYSGSKLLGMTGYFEPRNFFFEHGTCRFFLALRGDKAVGRCTAFINEDHNHHAKDKVGFFGHFECVNDTAVSRALLSSAETWLKTNGMETIRGPQSFPVNDSTPGFMVEGFGSRPVIYYHYNKPYYQDLARDAGFEIKTHVRSWEISVQKNDIEANLQRISEKVIKRYDIRLEDWGQRPYEVRKSEMFAIQNDAWNDNFGYVPFREKEFFKILDDMQMVMIKKLFVFAYVRGEPAGFFGGIPNLSETLAIPGGNVRGLETLRAIRMIFLKSRIKGFRIGYLGVAKKFRQMGLDGVMLWKQSQVTKSLGYTYADMGWVLENNTPTVRLIERCGAVPSKKYAIFEKDLTT